MSNYSVLDVGLVKDDTYEASFDVAMKYVWEISAGKAGSIDIMKLESQSEVPAIESNGKIKWITEERNGRYGAFMTQSNDQNVVWEVLKAIGTQGQSVLVSTSIGMVQSNVSGEPYCLTLTRKQPYPLTSRDAC